MFSWRCWVRWTISRESWRWFIATLSRPTFCSVGTATLRCVTLASADISWTRSSIQWPDHRTTWRSVTSAAIHSYHGCLWLLLSQKAVSQRVEGWVYLGTAVRVNSLCPSILQWLLWWTQLPMGDSMLGSLTFNRGQACYHFDHHNVLL